eukprot:TRINITY_DN7915_c0_g1_i1.p1 TRINITY_DN7915_c0_g1~~TRINITY_DN7915_c0_g1_i1.p1  ORF type:complete len:321 (-),score=53.90 TRINITY_DN7915_c0_g1_i1:182-1144(-)
MQKLKSLFQRSKASTKTTAISIFEACDWGNFGRVQELLLHNPECIKLVDKDGCTPLHFVCENGYIGIVTLLLEHGASVRAVDSEKCTALHFAAYGGHVNVVDVLLLAGCDPNARNIFGSSPLHWAANWGHIPVIKRLLMSGADATILDLSEKLPIDYATNDSVRDVFLQSKDDVVTLSSGFTDDARPSTRGSLQQLAQRESPVPPFPHASRISLDHPPSTPSHISLAFNPTSAAHFAYSSAPADASGLIHVPPLQTANSVPLSARRNSSMGSISTTRSGGSDVSSIMQDAAPMAVPERRGGQALPNACGSPEQDLHVFDL